MMWMVPCTCSCVPCVCVPTLEPVKDHWQSERSTRCPKCGVGHFDGPTWDIEGTFDDAQNRWVGSLAFTCTTCGFRRQVQPLDRKEAT